MLGLQTKRAIQALVLNCSVKEASLARLNSDQKKRVHVVESALDACLQQIVPHLSSEGSCILEEHHFPLFHLLPTTTALRFLEQELIGEGIQLSEDSFQPSLQLACSHSSGFLFLRAEKP